MRATTYPLADRRMPRDAAGVSSGTIARLAERPRLASPLDDDLRRARAVAAAPRRARPPGLRATDPDPGADDPRPARGPRRDRAGPDGDGQDRRVRPPAARLRRPGRPGGPGPRAHPDARAVHPGD